MMMIYVNVGLGGTHSLILSYLISPVGRDRQLGP